MQVDAMLRRALVALVVILILLPIMIHFFGLPGALFTIAIYRFIALTLFSKAVFSVRTYRPSLAAFRTHLVEVKSLARSIGFPLALAGIFAAPTIALVTMWLDDSVGIKGVASFALHYQIFVIATFVPTALSHYFVSKLSSNTVEQRGTLRNAIIATAIYGFLAGFGFVVVSKLTEAISHDLILNASASALFGFAIFAYSLSSAFQSYWAAIAVSKLTFYAQATWAACMLIVAWLYIPQHGVIGIASGFAVGSIGQLCVNAFAYRYISQNKPASVETHNTN